MQASMFFRSLAGPRKRLQGAPAATQRVTVRADAANASALAAAGNARPAAEALGAARVIDARLGATELAARVCRMVRARTLGAHAKGRGRARGGVVAPGARARRRAARGGGTGGGRGARGGGALGGRVRLRHERQPAAHQRGAGGARHTISTEPNATVTPLCPQ